jgi:hypothetical protein
MRGISFKAYHFLTAAGDIASRPVNETRRHEMRFSATFPAARAASANTNSNTNSGRRRKRKKARRRRRRNTNT